MPVRRPLIAAIALFAKNGVLVLTSVIAVAGVLLAGRAGRQARDTATFSR